MSPCVSSKASGCSRLHRVVCNLQVHSWQAEQTKQQKAHEVIATSRSLSGCLEMAQVKRMGESLGKVVMDSKTACRLTGEAAQAEMEHQREFEKWVHLCFSAPSPPTT